MDVVLRPGKPADAERCGAICYEAFRNVAQSHNFPPDIPSANAAAGFLGWMLSHPRFYAVVAERNGRTVGSNFLDERDAIVGIGPVTVEPEAQNDAIGRSLMEAVMARAVSRRAAGVRLVQAGYHARSLSLYTKLGFQVREPLVCLQGAPLGIQLPGRTVRSATEPDVGACNELCQRVHGMDRGGELLDAVHQGTANVVEYGGKVTGYATIIGFVGHAVGESNADVQALIGGAREFAGPGFLLPVRNFALFRWCLARGLRVIQPMTLMTMGLYNEPVGAFLPSILY